MTTTPRLGAPELTEGQAAPETTVSYFVRSDGTILCTLTKAFA